MNEKIKPERRKQKRFLIFLFFTDIKYMLYVLILLLSNMTNDEKFYIVLMS